MSKSQEVDPLKATVARAIYSINACWKEGFLAVEIDRDITLDIIKRLHISIFEGNKETVLGRCTELATNTEDHLLIIPMERKHHEIEFFGFDHGLRSGRILL